MKCSAVFFDRDGTVLFDRHYLHDPAGVELIPGTGEALRSLALAGVDAFLVSNQSGIGRGYFTEADLAACQARLQELLRGFGAGYGALRRVAGADRDRAGGASGDCRKEVAVHRLLQADQAGTLMDPKNVRGKS